MTQFPVGKRRPFTAKFVDAAGNAARVDGPATVSLATGTAFALEDLAADGLSGFVRCIGVGADQVQITADADLGSGTRSLTILGDVEGLAGEAVAGTVDFGPEE